MLSRLWNETVESVHLYRFRLLFGVIGLISVANSVYEFKERYLRPPVHFPYFGLDTWGPFPFWLLALMLVAQTVGALGFLLPKLYRSAALVYLVGYTSWFLIDSSYYNNHYYFIVLLSTIFCFVRPQKDQPWLPAWQLALFRFQIVLVYTFAGVAKLDRDWLLGDPARMWVNAWHYAPSPVVGEWVAYAICYFGLLFDFSVGWLLLHPRTRRYAMLAACGFHLFNAWHFEIGVFPWLMIGTNLIFFHHKQGPAGSPPPNWGKALIAVYVLMQIAIPVHSLRSYETGAWTERDHRWAWRMMLRTKQGTVTIISTDKTGHKRVVDVRPDLSPKQARSLASNPQRLVQYSRLLKARGAQHISVRSNVGLNGRSPQMLLDPNKDAGATPLYDLILPMERGKRPTPDPKPGRTLLGATCLLIGLAAAFSARAWLTRAALLSLLGSLALGFHPAPVVLALVLLGADLRKTGLKGAIALGWSSLFLLTLLLARPDLPY